MCCVCMACADGCVCVCGRVCVVVCGGVCGGEDSCRGGVAKYQYIYEQCGWDPATRDQQVKVSFKFDDGSWMK